MKAIQISIAVLLLMGSSSFRISDDGLKDCFVKVGETITFSNKLASPNERSSMSMKKSSYDGVGFHCKIDTAQGIQLNNITYADGPHQDLLFVLGCTGSLTRGEENLTFTFEKCRKTYYLINLDDAKLVGEFDTIVRMVLKAETSVGKPAEYYCSEKDCSGLPKKEYRWTSKDSLNRQEAQTKYISVNSTIHLTAVPSDIKKDELNVAKHPGRSIAHFTKIEIETAGGVVKSFPQGSYMLCEGSSLLIE